MKQAAAWAIHGLTGPAENGPKLIMGPNAHLVGLAQRHPGFKDALAAADLNIPDGISIVLAAKLLGTPVAERVTGGELMERLCREAAAHGFSVFLLGGLEEAAKLAALRLSERYPGLRIAGTYCPPHRFEHDPDENDMIFRRLDQARPDLLCVAFGAPKQELWMHRNRSRLPVRIALSVGAALDTQAGLRKRAPIWTHRFGAEWLYRMLAEPRRLWRRYLFGNSYFVFLVARQFLEERSGLLRRSTGNCPSGVE